MTIVDYDEQISKAESWRKRLTIGLIIVPLCWPVLLSILFSSISHADHDYPMWLNILLTIIGVVLIAVVYAGFSARIKELKRKQKKQNRRQRRVENQGPATTVA